MSDLDIQLIEASEERNFAAVKKAVEKGADVNFKDFIRLRRMILFHKSFTNSSSFCI